MLRFLTIGFLAFATPVVAAVLGDDGLHDAPWIEETFKDLREDHADALAQGKTLLIMIEQRGCIYCAKMHAEVFSDPAISEYIDENFFVVQLNLYGDIEVTDFDGTTLPEKSVPSQTRATSWIAPIAAGGIISTSLPNFL